MKIKKKFNLVKLLILNITIIVCYFALKIKLHTSTSSDYPNNPFGFHTGNAFPKDILNHKPNDINDPAIWGKYKYVQVDENFYE